MACLPSCCSLCGSCCNAVHNDKSSSDACTRTAIDRTCDVESARAVSATQEAHGVRERRQPHPTNFWPSSHLQARFVTLESQLRPRCRRLSQVTWPRWSDCAGRSDRSLSALRTFCVDLRTILRLEGGAIATPSWEDAPRRETLKTVLIFLQLPVIE